MYLKFKFIMSWELFDTKILKIVYIRDHYKEIIYDIIKDRADLNVLRHYDTIKKMI